MIGLFLLHVPCSFCGSIKVKGINLVEDGRSLGRQAEFGDARGDGERRQEKEASECDAASYLKYSHGPRPKKKFLQLQALRRTSLSCSRRLANRNGLCRKTELGGSSAGGCPERSGAASRNGQ